MMMSRRDLAVIESLFRQEAVGEDEIEAYPGGLPRNERGEVFLRDSQEAGREPAARSGRGDLVFLTREILELSVRAV
jgi:hypothetical protein